MVCRAQVEGQDKPLAFLCMVEPEFDAPGTFLKAAEQLKRKAGVQGSLKPLVIKEVAEATAEELELIPSPATGTPGDLTPPRDFNLMFSTQVGLHRPPIQTKTTAPRGSQCHTQCFHSAGGGA